VRKLVLLLVAVGVLSVTAASLAATRGAGWSAKLNATQEVPKQAVKAPAAHGSFTSTVSGNTLKWKLTFSKLSGPASAAHIHVGAMGAAGNVIVPLNWRLAGDELRIVRLVPVRVRREAEHHLAGGVNAQEHRSVGLVRH